MTRFERIGYRLGWPWSVSTSSHFPVASILPPLPESQPVLAAGREPLGISIV